MRVLVTGAGSGIDAAMVRRLVDEGADVLAVDLDPASVETLCAGLRADGVNGSRVEPLVCDLAVPDSPPTSSSGSTASCSSHRSASRATCCHTWTTQDGAA